MQRFAVIGLGRFGSRLAKLLTSGGAEVVAIDRDEGRVEALRDQVSLAVCMDATQEQALRTQGIDRVDVAIVGLGTEFESAILATVILKQLGVPRVLSRATSETRAEVLSRVGADDIVNPEREAAERWSERLLAPSIRERVELAEGYGIAQVNVPGSFVGRTLKDLNVSRRYKVLVVAIRRQARDGKAEGQPAPTPRKGAKGGDRPRITMPGPDTTLREGDVLVLIGSDEALREFPAE